MAAYLKKAVKDGKSVPLETPRAVENLLACIRQRGEAAVTELPSRISWVKGMQGHIRVNDSRLMAYYPDEKFEFKVYEQQRC